MKGLSSVQGKELFSQGTFYTFSCLPQGGVCLQQMGMEAWVRGHWWCSGKGLDPKISACAETSWGSSDLAWDSFPFHFWGQSDEGSSGILLLGGLRSEQQGALSDYPSSYWGSGAFLLH